MLNANAPHMIAARTHYDKPEVTADEVASEYPSYLTLDRETYTLRLWKDLKLAKTYTVAVGQVGLETPEGLYHIQDKQVDPTWNVPNPPGPAASPGSRSHPAPPTRSRRAGWGSSKAPASTAPKRPTHSAPPPRMAACGWRFPTWIELYDRVEVGTPIYIG